jgi:hypothetical protein
VTFHKPDDESQDVGSVLLEAHRLIHGDRNRDYGPFVDDFARTVAIFNAWTGRDLTTWEGIAFMVCVKQSRMIASPHVRDHYADAAGYIDGLHQASED